MGSQTSKFIAGEDTPITRQNSGRAMELFKPGVRNEFAFTTWATEIVVSSNIKLVSWAQALRRLLCALASELALIRLMKSKNFANFDLGISILSFPKR